MAEQKETGSIRVTDRRVAAQGGSSPAAAPETRPAEATASAPSQEAKAEAPEEHLETSKEPMPEVDFVTFVLSLSTNALVSMGMLPRPDTGEKKADLLLARQTIDILGLLQEKTKGNLTGEEERILDNVLYDLRMTYVQVVGKKS